MTVAQTVSARRIDCITEEELQLLIAKYTLDYLYRWTNEFDPASLIQVKKLFDAAETPQGMIEVLRRAGGDWPS